MKNNLQSYIIRLEGEGHMPFMYRQLATSVVDALNIADTAAQKLGYNYIEIRESHTLSILMTKRVLS